MSRRPLGCVRKQNAIFTGQALASVLILVFVASVAVRPSAAQTYRPIGMGALVLDDNHRHTLTLQTPQPGDAGYTDWTTSGNLVFRLPIPPSSNALMGFMLPGPSTVGPAQIPVWDPPTSAGGTGGAQGTWRSTSLASAIGSAGLVSGSGTANNLTKWTGAGTVGNSSISENAGAVTFGGYGSGVLHTDASGNITSTPVSLTGDVTNTLPATNGGTGNATYAAGDLLYASNSTTLSRLPAGTANQVLTMSGGAPTWVDPSSGSGSVTSVAGSGGTTGLSMTGGPITTSGTLTLGGTLVAANGGTGQSTYAAGDILYASSSTTLTRLSAGSNNQVLSISGGVPTWVDPSSGTGSVTSVDGSGGTTGLTLTGGPITTSGTLTLGGTLAVTNGGTGLSSYTSGGILYASSSSTIGQLTSGASNQVLGMSGGAPAWITNGATITNTTNTPASIVISQNDYTVDASSTYIRLSNISGGSLDITGINSTGVANGRVVTLVNTSTNPIVLRNQNGASAPADQFDLPGGADILLAQRGTATFIYDATLQFWELVSTN